MRARILYLMLDHDWHLKHPVLYTFWEWVVMPRSSGGRLGFVNWIKYCLR